MPIDQKILEIIPEEKYRELEKAGYKIVAVKTSEQLAFFDLEPALEIVQMVEDDIRDYRWMTKEIKRLADMLEEAGEGVTAKYDTESTLPKAKGTTSDPVPREVHKRERQWKRLNKLETKVTKIEKAYEGIKDERERTVLECMLDGVKMYEIAQHVGVSRQTLNEIKRNLITKMAWEIYGEDTR